MKVILMGDTHLGIKKGNATMMERHLQSWQEVVLYAVSNGIKNIIHLGDFFDDRNALTVPTIEAAREIVNKIEMAGLNLILLVGNHDVFFKNTNDVNSPEAVFDSTNIKVHTKPHTIKQLGIDLIPWINHANLESTIDFVAESKSKFCLGHFEFSGFPFHKGGRDSEAGLSPTQFANYTRVYSGHYHTQSTRKNIKYVGSSFEFTWADWNDVKGFHVLDTESGTDEFVRYSKRMSNFVYLWLDEEGEVDSRLPDITHEHRFVKIVVDGKPNKKVEDAIAEIEKLALSVDVSYTEELQIDKNVEIEEGTSEDSIIEHAVEASVANNDIRPAVVEYIESLKRAVA